MARVFGLAKGVSVRVLGKSKGRVRVVGRGLRLTLYG